MGLGDIKQRILFQFKSDTKQAQRGIGKLRKQTQDASRGMRANWMHVAGGIAAVTAAFQVARVAVDKFQEFTIASAAASKASIDELKKATKGYVSELDLLKFAAAATNSDFKIQQTELNEVAKFMIKLRAEGNELTKVQEKVTQAIVEGNVAALEEFGVMIESTGSKVNDHKKILEELARRNKEGGDVVEIAGDKFAKSAVKFDDAMQRMANAIGKLATKLTPVIEQLAQFIDKASRIASGDFGDLDAGDITKLYAPQLAIQQAGLGWLLGGSGGGSSGTGTQNGRSVLISGGSRAAEADRARIAREEATIAREKNDAAVANSEASRRARIAYSGAGGMPSRFGSGGGSGGGPGGGGSGGGYTMNSRIVEGVNVSDVMRAQAEKVTAALLSAVEEQVLQDRIASQAEHGTTTADISSLGLGGGSGGAALQFDEGVTSTLQQAKELMNLGRGTQTQGKFLENIFGPVGQFNVYASGFNMLTDASTAAMDAWITGSSGMVDAFNRAIGESLRMLASQMLVESLKHGAYALGSLAFWDLPGAAKHGAAAAGFGAGAVAAGLAAKAMGAGGPPPGSGGGGGGGAQAAIGGSGSMAGIGGSSAQGGDRSVTIVMGSDFAGMGALERREKIGRTIEEARAVVESDVVEFT